MAFKSVSLSPRWNLAAITIMFGIAISRAFAKRSDPATLPLSSTGARWERLSKFTFVVFALFVVNDSCRRVARWIPACAGMTGGRVVVKARVLPGDGPRWGRLRSPWVPKRVRFCIDSALDLHGFGVESVQFGAFIVAFSGVGVVDSQGEVRATLAGGERNARPQAPGLGAGWIPACAELAGRGRLSKTRLLPADGLDRGTS